MAVLTEYVPATDIEGAKIRLTSGDWYRLYPWRDDHREVVVKALGGDYIGDELTIDDKYIGWVWVRSPNRLLARDLEIVKQKYAEASQRCLALEKILDKVKEALDTFIRGPLDRCSD